MGLEKDIDLCASTIHELAERMTRIPLAVITHASVRRMIAVGTPNTKFLYKMTLELLQYVSVAMVTAVSYHDACRGQ